MVEPHTERPATAEDSSAVQAGTYSELVNTVLFFVSQGTEKGLIQLTDDYDGDVEEDLNRACLEVAKDDPLGAYAVDFIKNDCTKVLTTYEATITISYRRTREQIRSLVNVTGTSAIRDEVRAALADFQSEVALRVGYFTESADSIAALVRQAYYDEPAGALGMPEFTVSLYPASGGQQRIVEILLTYPEYTQALRQKSVVFFFFKQKTAYEISACLVGSDVPYLKSVESPYERQYHEKMRRIIGKDYDYVEYNDSRTGEPYQSADTTHKDLGGFVQYNTLVSNGRSYRYIGQFVSSRYCFDFSTDAAGVPCMYYYGFGHGVGMSQCGAVGYAAEEGMGYRDILKHYYSGVSIRTVGSGTSSGGGLFSWLRRLLGM